MTYAGQVQEKFQQRGKEKNNKIYQSPLILLGHDIGNALHIQQNWTLKVMYALLKK